MGKVATSPLRSRGSPPVQSGGKIGSGPLVDKVATSNLPPRGSLPLHKVGQKQRWHTVGQGGYIAPAVSGIPTFSEQGAKSEMAHLWAKWLLHPCRLGDLRHCRTRGEIRSTPLMGNVATSLLLSWGTPPFQRGPKWPACGQSGYITPAVSGIPTASERAAKSEVAHLRAKLLLHPCSLRDPHRFRTGGKIGKSPLVGKVATSPLPFRGYRPLQSRGQNQKMPPCGQSGSVKLAISGIATASGRGAKSEVAHLWAKSLRHPCRLGDPQCWRAAGKIRNCPLVG